MLLKSGHILFCTLISNILLLCSPVFASETVSLDDELSIKNITQYLEYIEYTGKDITFDHITSGNTPEWTRADSSYMNFGYTRSRFWFRFSVNNTTQNTKKWLLEIDFPPIDRIDLHVPDGKGGYSVKKTGDQLPFSSRDIKDRNFIFKLNQGPGIQTYYIRIDSLDSINFNLNMLTYIAYTERLYEELPIYFLFYGLMLVMFLYNLFLFITLRDLEYLYFCGFISSMTLFELNFKGFATQFLWPNATWWSSHANPFFVGLFVMFMSLFLVEFVDFKRLKPFLYKVFLVTISLPAFILSVISLVLDLQISLLMLLILGLWFTLFATILGIYLSFFYKPPSRQARIALLSFSLFAITAPIVVLTMLGILPANFFTRWAMQIGTSLIVILLSLGLADKINSMKNKIQKAEKKYRHLVESSDDVIFSLDQDLNFLSINTSIKKHLGYKDEELLNTNFLDLIQEPFSEQRNIARQIVTGFIDEMIREKKSVELRTTFKTRFGFEPKELAVKLEYTVTEETGYTILGKASQIIDDTVLPFLEYERFTYSVNNYMNNAEIMSHRLSRNLNKYLSRAEIIPLRISLRETLINAIEHGNLNLTFQEKTDSMMNDCYLELLRERQRDPLHSAKRVTIDYSLNRERVVYKFSDEGNGFDHCAMDTTDTVSNVNEEMLFHGRGLAMIRDTFDEVRFNKCGNQIMLVKYFKG